MSFALDLTALSAAYRREVLTPLDVVDQIFERLSSTPHSGVFIHELSHEQVARAARDVMERRAHGEPMRLYGVPFVVKDNIDVVGLPTTAACPAFAHVATGSADCVVRLLAQGAILVGKTNLDQFATGLVGVRSPYGIPANPFDAERVAGGSSSGSAVAVALGFCSFALATDTAGSGRVPAAFNNLVGLKPTRGMISTRGVVPACRSLDCVAVFATSVSDATEVGHVLAGFDPRDPYARPDADRWDPRPAGTPSGFRFATPIASQLTMSAPYGAAMFDSVAERLTRLGGVRREIDLAPFTRVAELLYGGPFVAERLEAAGELLERDPGAIEPTVRTILEGATSHGALGLFRAQHQLQRLRTLCEPLWDEVDCLVVPSAPTLPRIADVLAAPIKLNAELGTYTNFVNLLDLCALAIPGGWTQGGLPFGVTLIAPSGRDATLASIGQVLQHDPRTPAPDATPAQPAGKVVPTRAAQASLAVLGAHLSGEPLNHQLTERGARLLCSTRTTASYRLFSLPTTPPKPGLVRTAPGEAGHAIELEVWQLSDEALGSFMRLVADPLCIGTLELEDGSRVLGFLCEAAATQGQPDISSFGGWRNFRRAQR